MGLEPLKSPVPAIRSVDPAASSGKRAQGLAGARDPGVAGEPPILRGLRIRPPSLNSAPWAPPGHCAGLPVCSCLAHCTSAFPGAGEGPKVKDSASLSLLFLQ